MENVSRALDAANNYLREECGKEISLNELANLVAVYLHGGSGLAFTARQLGISSAGMTGAMDSLEYKGLAVRTKDPDRRKFRAAVTEKGMIVLRRASDLL
jgi:DNA-binding MarR family transcriptional regulator